MDRKLLQKCSKWSPLKLTSGITIRILDESPSFLFCPFFVVDHSRQLYTSCNSNYFCCCYFGYQRQQDICVSTLDDSSLLYLNYLFFHILLNNRLRTFDNGHGGRGRHSTWTLWWFFNFFLKDWNTILAPNSIIYFYVIR